MGDLLFTDQGKRRVSGGAKGVIKGERPQTLPVDCMGATVISQDKVKQRGSN